VVAAAKRRLVGPLLGPRAPEVDSKGLRRRFEQRVALSMLGATELTDKHNVVPLRNIADPVEDSVVEPDSQKMRRRAKSPEEVRKGGYEDVVGVKPTGLR
jgi:hypothetical protein